MTSVLLLATPDPGAPPLAADFTAAGFEVRGEGDCAHLVRAALQSQADVLVCWAPRPAAELLQSVATLQAQQHVPVLFFVQDAGVEGMERALEAGVHAWVVQGYAPQRLRSLVHLAQLRAILDASPIGVMIAGRRGRVPLAHGRPRGRPESDRRLRRV